MNQDMPFKEFIVMDKLDEFGAKDGRFKLKYKNLARQLGDVDSRRVRYEFPNGYGASVIMGELFHTSKDCPYEIGLLHHGKLDYNALGGGIDDVLSFQTDADLMIVLAKLMALPKEQE